MNKIMTQSDATHTHRSQRTPEELFRTGGAVAWVSQADDAFWHAVVGERVGAYELTALLGEGGMSVVFRARRADGVFEREVAVKFIRQSVDAERLLAEARTVATLKHPGIVDLIDAGRWRDDIPYLVLELVEGRPLNQYIDDEVPDFDPRIALWLAIADAVAYAHSHFLAHRDIKPANILVDGKGRPRLLDFGIASGLHENSGTASGRLAGTPYYMAPEQLPGGRADGDHGAADQFALGVLLAELLLDRRLRSYQAASRSLTRMPGLAEAWSGLDVKEKSQLSRRLGVSRWRLDRWLRGDLDAVLAKAIHGDASERYRSVAELAADVRRWLAGNCVEASPAGPFTRLQKLLWRHRRMLTVAGLVLAALAAQLATTFLRLSEERDRAVQAESAARASTQFLVEVLSSVDPLQSQLEKLTAADFFHRAVERSDQIVATAASRGEILLALAGLGIGLSELELAEQLLQQARAAFADSHPDDPLIAARLDHATSRLRYYQGDSMDAFQMARQAWTRMRGIRGDDDAETFEMSLSMATLNPDRGAAADALRNALQSPLLDPQASQEKRDRRTAILINLAYVLDADGEYDRALAVIDEALGLLNEATRPNLRPAVLSTRAYVQFHRRQLDAARSTELESLASKRQLFPAAHLSIFSSLDTLARIEQAARDYQALLSIAQESLAELQKAAIDRSVLVGKQRVWNGRAALAELRLGREAAAVERLQWVEANFPSSEADAFDALCATVYAAAGKAALAGACRQRWMEVPDRPAWVSEELLDFQLERPGASSP